MSLFSMLKRNTRLALRGCWGRAILASAVVLGASVALSMVQGVLLDIFAPPVSIDPVLALRYGFSEYFFEQFAQTSVVEWAILAAFALVELLLLVPLTLGVTRWNYLLVQAKDPALSEIFYFFETPGRFGRSIWLHINLLIRCLFWALLLLLLPMGILGASVGVIRMGEEAAGRTLASVASVGVALGVLVMLLALFLFGALISRYLPASYLLCEDGDVSVRKALRESVRFSRGYRFSLLWYQLSFIGWGLLCVFVFPMLYVVPYFNASVAMYARYIIERGRFSPPGPTREFRPEESGTAVESAGEAFLSAESDDPYFIQERQPGEMSDSPPRESLWQPPAADWPGSFEGAAGEEAAPVSEPREQPDPAEEYRPGPSSSSVRYPDYQPKGQRGQLPVDEDGDPAIWPEPDPPFRGRKW